MPKAKRLTAGEFAGIKRLITEGWSDREIAAKTGRSRQSVNKLRHQESPRNVTTHGRTITVRLTAEEYEGYRDFVKGRGLTVSDGVRRLIRLALGALDLQREEVEAIAAARRELAAVGRNLNQLTKLAQAGRLRWNRGDAALVKRVGDRTLDLTEAVSTLATVAHRRTLVDAAAIARPEDG